MNNTFRGYHQSPIGTLEISGTPNGISAVSFVDKAVVSIDASPELKDCISQLDEYFSGKRKEFSIELDVRGTDFQKSVWHELLKIPFGKTGSYQDIAMVVGTGASARDVGRANGQNPIAIIIPCHRVIGSDSSLTGYRAGLGRKRWLLNFESSTAQPELFAANQNWNAGCR
jgi:methylated-DNA-[protein]-cysteine S-methyltransferase